jgi:hypothetical protein
VTLFKIVKFERRKFLRFDESFVFGECGKFEYFLNDFMNIRDIFDKF